MKTQRHAFAPTRSRRLNEMLGLIVLVAAALLLLALLTYTPLDPSLDTAGGLAQSARISGVAHPAHNWAGLVGAYTADLLLQWTGVAIFLLPLMLLRLGVSWMRSRRVGGGFAKLIGLMLWMLVAPAAFALLPWHVLYAHALPLPGVEGRLLADGMVHFVNLPGAIVVTALLVVLSLYLATTFTLHTADEWFTGHFAFVGRARQRLEARRHPPAAVSAPVATYVPEILPAARAVDAAELPSLEHSSEPARQEAESTSLLSSVLRVFQRRRGLAVEELSLTRAMLNDTPSTAQSVWQTVARPSAMAAAGMAAAAGADGTPAAHMGALPAAEGAELSLPFAHAEERGVAFDTHEAAREQHAAREQPTVDEDDDWLNSPERNQPLGVQPLAAAPAHDSAEPVRSNVMPFPVSRGRDMDESASAAKAVPPRYVPAPFAPEALPPMPSPMANIADQNIAFGRRADADIRPVAMTAKSIRGYKLPPSSLLFHSGEQTETREEELLEQARMLVEKCAEFGVDGTVTQINPGPVVTTFEFRPNAGVKVARITGLADDLCLAMSAESVIIERMAGKNTVGIQVPNRTRETIWLRDTVECESFAQSKSKLAIALGKDINGRIVTADLAGMPHVLIAGSTGSGKSVAINAMIMSVLFKSTPEQVRMILVDPKRVELGMYEGIPHLFTPIITEAKQAANALRNAVKEMERRLKLLAANHVRNIDQFNKLFESGSEYLFEDVNQEPLPYIMIIIDELADLMMLDRANVEESITRLAQMARAVGIHLVLATQRPSVDVITGLLKANVPTRMSFRLATKIDSRTIIDSNGAESLLGRGDMLFLPPGTARLQRVHAPFVTEKEISDVTKFWREQGEAEYAEGFLEAPRDEKGNADGEGANSGEDADPMFDDAVRLIYEFGKASTSLLQRRLRIGYGRAAHLIDMMEKDGLVGPADGSRPRELLKPAAYFAEADAAMR